MFSFVKQEVGTMVKAKNFAIQARLNWYSWFQDNRSNPIVVYQKSPTLHAQSFRHTIRHQTSSRKSRWKVMILILQDVFSLSKIRLAKIINFPLL